MVNSTRVRYHKLRKTVLNSFPNYYNINKYEEVLKKMYPNNIRIETIGFSSERRPIHMIILQESQEVPKYGTMIESGIHAREWITHTTALYIVDVIASKKKLLKYMDFYIIPCINPDGYEYSRTKCRFWRKNMNRNNQTDSLKWGVDLNRNFPCGFGGVGSSARVRSLNYKGRNFLSEPESRSLAKTITKYAHCIKLYISLHSFGEMIMYPWGYTTEELEDVKDLHDCATKAQECMRGKFPKSRFRVGQLSRIQYRASGITIDYVRDFHNIKFIFSIEMHREGPSGFTPTPERILPIGEEIFAIIASMVKYVTRYYQDVNNAEYEDTSYN